MRISVIIIAVAFLTCFHIVQAQSASGQFKISNPQVVFTNPGSSEDSRGGSTLELRIGKAGMERFILNGGLIEDSQTSLQTRASTSLLELESDNKSFVQNVRVSASSFSDVNEFIFVTDQKLFKSISYSTSHTLGSGGLSTSLSINTPPLATEYNQFLGTIVITVGAY